MYSRVHPGALSLNVNIHINIVLPTLLMMYVSDPFIVFCEQMFNSLSQMLMMNGIVSKNRMVPHSIPNITRALSRDDFFVSTGRLSLSKLMDNYYIHDTPIFQFPKDDIRVIFVNTYSDVARVVMCEVGVIIVNYCL